MASGLSRHAPALDLAAPAPARQAARARWGLVALGVGLLLLFVLFAGGLVLIPRYRAAHPVSALQRSDADTAQIDDLYLDLTLATPAFLQTRHLDRYFEGRKPATVLPVLVGVNTHTGSIEHMHRLQGSFLLVGPDGERYPSLTSPIVLSEHHNAYMVLFPARDNHGRRFLDMGEGRVAVEATHVGAEPIRRFEWRLPIVDDLDGAAARHGLTATLMLAVALVGALLVILSPCALELTLYYSAIISCTVTQSEREAVAAGASAAARIGRRRLLVNLASFVAGFTLLYAASGATVGLIGEGVRKPLGEYGRLIQLIGGSLILLFALRILGVGVRLRRLTGRLPRPGGRPGNMGGAGLGRARFLAPLQRLFVGLRLQGRQRAAAGSGMRAIDSFLVGIGLSTSCLTCMGGAVLYPLLVYAGITSWYSGLITLALYSLGIAVPMVCISLGFFQIRLSLAERVGLNRALRTASGVVLAGIALLVLFGRERIVTDLTFRFLGGVLRWFA
jgi:cytochrome c biogenesis protein CcdA